MGELFNLFGLLDSVDGHNAALGFLQVVFQFQGELQHLFGIAPDLDLPLQVRGGCLLSLDVVPLRNRSIDRFRPGNSRPRDRCMKILRLRSSRRDVDIPAPENVVGR